MASQSETIKRIKYYSELRDSTLETLKSLTEKEIEQYSFSDSNATQSARRRRIDELRKALEEYEKQIDQLERTLNGGGIRTFTTNRYK